MDMELVEDQVHMIKGRRTKRQRPSSPFDLASSSSVGGSSCGGDEFVESTEEEEDMANCLILLAQGHNKNEPKRVDDENGGIERYHSRKFVEATPISSVKGGLYVYQCKTCNRCFPSFQALGGHRASHKKPKGIVEDKDQFNNTTSQPLLPLHIGNRAMYSNNKSKVHECSICGAEFSSGQALGGHMRRHRTPTNTAMTMMTNITSESHESSDKKPRNVLALDLNLPAPEEDHRENIFSFAPTQPPLIFSASALVDCHY